MAKICLDEYNDISNLAPVFMECGSVSTMNELTHEGGQWVQ